MVMRVIAACAAVLALLIVPVCAEAVQRPQGAPGVAGHRIALVVANAAYRSVPMLKNPARDADMVARALRGVGFQTVTLAADVDRERLLAALQDFARAAAVADWAVIYYAGHGIEMDGTNYLIPVDARLQDERDVPKETVEFDRLFKAIEGAKAMRLLFLDACRDNPFLGTMRRADPNRPSGQGLAVPNPTAGTLMVYSTKAGAVALDGAGDNSPFALALAGHMATPGLDVRNFLGRVRDDVLRATGNRQSPFAFGSVPRGDYFFLPP